MTPIGLLLDAKATIAESLLWAPDEGAIYWMDVKEPALHRLQLLGARRDRWPLPSDIGAFALLEDRRAVVALRTGIFVLSLDTGTLDISSQPPFDPLLHRFNEGACDAAGRFWVGTMFDPLPGHDDMPPQHAVLGTWTVASGYHVEPDAAELHNGMAWSPDGTLFYLAHSQSRTVFAFPFDVRTGHLGTREVFVTTPDGRGIPDGAAVDEEGAYWCALHGGGALRRYAPDGELLREIALPVSQPTMVAFGGDDLRTLYVASAREKLGSAALRREPNAGGLFHLNAGVRGIERQGVAR